MEEQRQEEFGVAVITYRDEDSGLVYRWHGGCYVDVSFEDGPAFDVLNVWDCEVDRSYLEQRAEGTSRPFRTILELFEERCQQNANERMTEDAAERMTEEVEESC